VQALRILDRIGAIEFHNNRHHDGADVARAYRRAGRSEAFAQSDWCMALDADEFLNVTTGEATVSDLIAACPGTATAIVVNRRIFGSGGARDVSGKLVTERFTRAEPAGTIRRSPAPVRTLFRTDAYHRPGPHLPEDPRRGDILACNASGLTGDALALQEGEARDPEGRKFAQINHYTLRDMPRFLLERAAHGPDAGLAAWRALDRNEEEDTSLALRTFAVWAEMKRLDEETDGRLLRLRQRGQRQAGATLKNLLQDATMQALHAAITADAEAGPMRKPFKLPGVADPVFSSVRPRKTPDGPLVLRKAIG
jgi:hypothetical protein